jgi:hypothetical protein
MARPSKGDRHTMKLTIDLSVRRQIHCLATDARMSVSQYLADHLALHVGRPDLVYTLGGPPLVRFRPTNVDPESPNVIVRCPVAVYQILVEEAKRRGQKVANYVADFCTDLARGDAVPRDRDYGYQEVLATSA